MEMFTEILLKLPEFNTILFNIVW